MQSKIQILSDLQIKVQEIPNYFFGMELWSKWLKFSPMKQNGIYLITFYNQEDYMQNPKKNENYLMK